MWSRVVTAKVAPSNLDEAIRLWRDSVVPLNRQQKGWVSGRMLVDRKTGKALVVALWQTEADHKATSGPYLRSQFDKFMALFVEPPIEELNEVAAEGWPYRLRCSVSPSPTLRPSGLTNRWSERS